MIEEIKESSEVQQETPEVKTEETTAEVVVPEAVVLEVKKEERPYITIDQMYAIGRRFAERVFGEESIAKKLRASGVIINFKYFDERWGKEEPEVTVDTTQDPVKLYTGPCELKPTVLMRMHADTAHRFWMQRVNLMVAITKGEIRAKGPIPTVMKLLPTIKPSFQIYKEVLQELGLIELLSYPK